MQSFILLLLLNAVKTLNMFFVFFLSEAVQYVQKMSWKGIGRRFFFF